MLVIAIFTCVLGVFLIFLSGMIFSNEMPEERGKLDQKTFTNASSVVGLILLAGLGFVGASISFMAEAFSTDNAGTPGNPSIITEICRLEGVIYVDDWGKNVAVATNSAGKIICVLANSVPEADFIKWSIFDNTLLAVNPSTQELPIPPDPNAFQENL